MKSKKVLTCAPRALGAVLVCVCLLAGCRKEEPKAALPEVYPAEGHAYMMDPAFLKQLKAQEQKRTTILDTREEIIAEFEKLKQRYGSREAAEKSPEFPAINQRMRACEQAFESNRVESAHLIDARMRQAQADSERIARGEAQAAKPLSK